MMTKERYKHEYVNCEVSEIIDTVENKSLTAEEITDRLNNLYKEKQRLKTRLQEKDHLLQKTLKTNENLQKALQKQYEEFDEKWQKKDI